MCSCASWLRRWTPRILDHFYGPTRGFAPGLGATGICRKMVLERGAPAAISEDPEVDDLFPAEPVEESRNHPDIGIDHDANEQVLMHAWRVAHFLSPAT